MKVCIYDEGFIPGLGKGPFREPVEITEDKYLIYKQMGLKIIDATKYVSIAETGVINRVSTPKKSQPIVEEKVEVAVEVKPVVKEETKTEPVIEETKVEEEIKEETVEEVAEPEDVEEVEITEEELKTYSKKELIELLTDNEIEFDSKATKKDLLAIALKLI